MSIYRKNQIDQIVEKLKDSQCVALPTETVYGLAARIDNEVAIKKIFKTKQRPFFDPLIVHVSNANMAKPFVSEAFEILEILAKKFWPGPLTIVVRKTELISDLITSGLPSVALRCPQHPLFLEVLKQVNVPLAAPSANLFGKVSPTSAQHVEDEFDSQVDVLDGGECQIGVESTIVMLEKSEDLELSLLRPGVISLEEVKNEIEANNKYVKVVEARKEDISPGKMENHYQPDQPLIISPADLKLDLFDIGNKLSQKLNNIVKLNLSPSPAVAARQLYSELRRLSQVSETLIVFEKFEMHNKSEWNAVMDRLKKASSLEL